MTHYLELIDQWMEAPQVVLDGTELLILIGLVLIWWGVMGRKS